MVGSSRALVESVKSVRLAVLLLAILAAWVLIPIAKEAVFAASESGCIARSAPKLDDLEGVGAAVFDDVDPSRPYRDDYCESGYRYPVVGYVIERWESNTEAKKHFRSLGWTIASRKLELEMELADRPTAVSPDGEYLAPIQGPWGGPRSARWGRHMYVSFVHSSTPSPPNLD